MTEVAFHFNAPDQSGYTCRLIRKAYARGARVLVTGPWESLKALDHLLWTFAALEFVPHCFVKDEPAILARSPVVLADSVASVPAELDSQVVLVNLGQEVPTGFERFERLIEVVTQAEEDRSRARKRWKYYADRGYPIQRHDLAGS